MKLFLDIDGVMVHANPHRKVDHDEDGFYRFDIRAMEALMYLLANIDIEEIILSTSHRFSFSLTEWQQLLSNRGIKIPIISRIESVMTPQKSRYEEIQEWVDHRHLKVDQILIIDDDHSLNGLPSDIKARLILTSPYVGLRMRDIEEYLSS